MADFENGQDNNKHSDWDKQIKEDRLTSFMFGHRRENIGQEPHPSQEPTHNQSTIDFEELFMNLDTLVDSVRGLKPLFNKVYPYIQQLWTKK